MRRSLLALLLAVALPVHADWYLDNESSRLSFISTHSSSQSEVHRFLTLHGQIAADGRARLRVDLDSVSTGIALRDERLRVMLFDTARLPEARISAQVNLAQFTDLAPGAQLELRLPLQLTLNERSRELHSELLVTRLDDRRFQVVTLAPLVLHAEDFALASAIEALRKLADLPAISLSVPVGAVLIFTAR
ncbi:YceI family protein [Pseudomonas wenzhouensis]|uniref:YceI family protein n=1 Tax=Pseudomonas wenzhouensis TaxID=2906062 RepID=UPI001E41E1CE|nr:YceI family protein [Pseudomonas wenzhouensis]UFQ98598.1 YceI family protein [Pseudomonas wenzhouensis]